MKKSACLWTAFVLTTGIIAGAMVHSWCCARLTAEQQHPAPLQAVCGVCANNCLLFPLFAGRVHRKEMVFFDERCGILGIRNRCREGKPMKNKKGIIIFLLLGVLAFFLYNECEYRINSYQADPIGTAERKWEEAGFTLPLRHIPLADGENGKEPLILEDQGFITYAAGRWLCQLSPSATHTPDFEQPGNEGHLAVLMDGTNNTIAYCYEQGYQPLYFFSYYGQMYLVSGRTGTEYVMPTQKLEAGTADLYQTFQRPIPFGQFLRAVRSFAAAGCPEDNQYGLIF